jgi:mono/diheme cytochrome c family protein
MKRRMLPLLLATAALCGCERVMRDMVDQPRQNPATASPLFPDRTATRPPPPGAAMHARGDAAATSSGRLGTDAVDADVRAAALQQLPAQPGRAMLLRGRERYTIYCVPCHSPLGDGDGRVVRRGFPAPPSYHIERLLQAPDRHFYDVITEGHGVMASYADRVAPADRWAIVAYIRALQLSQHAPVAELPPELQQRVARAEAPAAKERP